MIQSRSARRWRPTTLTLPGIKPYVVMVATSRDKCRILTEALRHLKPENTTIELESPFEVRHFEMHMSDSYLVVY